jgi:tetratricopeptide (TPR) repeat protein
LNLLEILDEAAKVYKKALEKGSSQNWSIEAMNNLGRVYIGKKDLDLAETYLRMGLHEQEKVDKFTVPLLDRNLGWVAIEREKYADAEKELRRADALEQQLDRENPDYIIYGEGLSCCAFKLCIEADGETGR